MAAFLVYVDVFLVAGPRFVLQALLNQLLKVWKGNSPDFLGREPGVDSLTISLSSAEAEFDCVCMGCSPCFEAAGKLNAMILEKPAAACLHHVL